MSRVFVPDQKYNPEWQPEITPATLIGPSIPLNRFLSGIGQAGNINHINNGLTTENRTKLAKAYHMHAAAWMSAINDSRFYRNRIRIAEGYYKLPDPTKAYDIDSVLYLRNKGQAVVYECLGEDGEVDIEKTWDLALHFCTHRYGGLPPQKTILNYDNYNPNGRLHAQVTLIMPEIETGWLVRYAVEENIVETKYNGHSQATGELIEVLQEERTDTILYG